jgi:hypothetical protein
MSRLRRALAFALVLAPPTAVAALAVARPAVVDQAVAAALAWAKTDDAVPVLVAGGLVLSLLLTAATLLVVAKVVYALGRSSAGPAGRLYRLLSPTSTMAKFAVFFAVAVALMGGTALLIPGNVGTLANSSVGDLAERGLDGIDVSVLEGGAIRYGGGGGGGGTGAWERPTPDADGDRLADAWEEEGVGPDGARLPGADPDRMDIYVQVNHGMNQQPLTDAEVRQLKRVWAEMPVENPDGSTGVTLHLVEGGSVGEPIVVSGSPDTEDMLAYYTPEYMGARPCRYHQVVLADLQAGNVVGWGGVPGWVALVEADRNQTAEGATVSERVATITHELLHNVAGQVEGQAHTSRGWLSHGATASNEFLSTPVTQDLNENGFVSTGFHQNRVC